jgi:Protein of unknown function (DUF3305)
MNPHAERCYPLSLVLSRKWLQSAQWRYQHWDVVAILPQASSASADMDEYRRVHIENDSEHFLYSGLSLELFRDGLQAYYQNITGAQPSLFVLCHDDETYGGITPVSVSANHADAEGHLESDGIVLSTPLRAPFSGWLADYVLKNQNLLDQQLQDLRHDKKGKRRHV